MIEIKIGKDCPSGTIFIIPRFVLCPLCQHEIPIGEIIDNILGPVELDRVRTDFGGCGKTFQLYQVAKYFGVIKNIG